MYTVQLPVKNPEFSTYQCIACPEIVASQNPTADNWYFNNSLQIRCNKDFNEQNRYDLEPVFTLSGYARMQEILEYHTLPRKLFIEHSAEMICYCLEHGYYAYIDCYDEFYLENARLCDGWHTPHDCLITGYDKDTDRYHIGVYTKKDRFGFIDSSRESLERALFSEYMTSDPMRDSFGYLCALKAKDVEIPFDMDAVRQGITDYLSGVPEVNDNPDCPVAIGFEVWKYLLKYIDFATGQLGRLDARVSLFFYEYKNFYLKLIQKIEAVTDLGTLFSQSYTSVVQRAVLMHHLFLKMNMTDDYSNVQKLTQLVQMNMQEEYSILSKIRKSF